MRELLLRNEFHACSSGVKFCHGVGCSINCSHIFCYCIYHIDRQLVVFGDFVWISLRAHLRIVVERYGSSHYWLTSFELKPYSLMQLYGQVVDTDCAIEL